MSDTAHRSTAGDARAARQPQGTGRLIALLLAAALAALQGCAALSNPTANGIPVRRLPPELLAPSKKGLQTVPLTMLRQPPPNPYRLAPGDVLGVWVQGVLGEKDMPPLARVPETSKQPPSIGYPILVRHDGTISLPLVPPINVAGMSVPEAENAVRKAYVERDVIKAGREQILVTLQRPRESHILVIRQDGLAETPAAGGGVTGARTAGILLTFGGGARGTRRGTGYSIDLPAYENDLLDALARTGGFPSTDGANEVIIERGAFQDERGRQNVVNSLQACPGANPFGGLGGTQRIRIPLRYRPGQVPNIRPEDVILRTGDVVLIESREADVFYTAGLLPSGEYVLPRDTDLDVIQAILRVGGPIEVSGLNTANINGSLILPGLSLPNPTLLSVLRKTPDGGQVMIRVDLDVALRDPRERILVQAEDLLILQERPQEALARYLSETFNFRYVYTFINNRRNIGTVSTSQALQP